MKDGRNKEDKDNCWGDIKGSIELSESWLSGVSQIGGPKLFYQFRVDYRLNLDVSFLQKYTAMTHNLL